MQHTTATLRSGLGGITLGSMTTMPPFAIERPKTAAQKLLAEASSENEWPIPLEKVAAHLGYKVFGFDPKDSPELDEVSGFVNHDERAIYINTGEPLYRQRFTLAHEIAHAHLHGGEAPVDYRKTFLVSPDPKEVEANRFAADLLMDPLIFVKKWLSLGCDIQQVARYFGVSEDSARIRARYLGVDRA